MKTIKQIADELGVSKTAVRKYMTPEFREAYTETKDGNIILIDEDGCRVIAETIKKHPETTGNQLPETRENPGLQEEISFLREQLQAKDRQLEAKDRQLEAQQAQIDKKETEILNLTAALENATSSLKTAQALHAGTMQQQLDAGEPQADPECQNELVIDVDAAAPAPADLQEESEPEKVGKLKKIWFVVTGKL